MEMGNLEMIMRISRWHGMAPYSSLSTLEVSRGYVVYGIVLVSIYSYPFIFGIGREIYAIWLNTQTASVGQAVAIGTNMISLLSILMILPRAPRRLTHIKHSIKKLNEINMKLNHKIGNGKGKYQYIIICCILIQFGIRLVDYFINANYYTMYFDSFQREGKKIIFLQSLRELNIHYSAICDIVRDSMQLDGLLFCFFIINYFARFQINLFFLLFWKISTQLSLYDNTAIVLSIIWIFIHGKYFIIFVEPFHRTFNEMQRTILLVNSLKAAVIDDEIAKNEIETFQHILILNEPTFSPLNMFTINRSLILKIVGGVLTYTVTCLTYAPEMKRPTSFLNKYFLKNASTD